MREKGVHADLRHGRIENQLVLAVFMMHKVVVVHGHAAKRLAVGRQAIPKHAIVRGIRNAQQNQRRQQPSQNDSLEPWAGLVAELVAFDRSHGVNYTRARSGPESEVLTILHRKTRPDSLQWIGSLQPSAQLVRQKGSGRY